jgi:catechol 2,3-dioxygenase-like lactoylglutathione lyase family enzyme
MIGRMRATALNHVSIPATDVDASCRFYEEVFGMERIPSPNFGAPVRWLRLGDLQLHIFHVDEQPQHTYQHLGIEVDDFEAAYRKLKERDAFDKSPRFRPLWELPGGEVQMYFRDPADNFVEIDWPDVTTLDRSVFGDDLEKLADVFPQGPENLGATLFLRLREAVGA